MLKNLSQEILEYFTPKPLAEIPDVQPIPNRRERIKRYVGHYQTTQISRQDLFKLEALMDNVTVNDNGGRPVMAFRTNSAQDGELVVSLDGAISIAATLLRNEDDFPRKYYFATDGGNNNPLGRPVFILRSEGVAGSPIFPWGSFQVLCIGG